MIKIEDKHEGETLKELLNKVGIKALLYNYKEKEVEIVNGKFVFQKKWRSIKE